MPMEQLETVIAAWIATDELDAIEPVSAAEIEEAERALGFALSPQLRRLYEFSDAVSIGSGELNVAPLLPDRADPEDSYALTTTSDRLHAAGWEIPAPLLLFADNGGEEHYGLWIDPEDRSREPIVVELGEGGVEGGSLAIVGVDLGAFLLARTAQVWIYPPDWGGDPEAVRDELGVPEAVMAAFTPPTATSEEDGLEEYWEAVYQWASPGIPSPVPDVYEDGLTAEQVQELSRRIPR